MPHFQRHFTLGEALDILPEVKEHLRQIVSLKSSLEVQGFDMHQHPMFAANTPVDTRRYPPAFDALMEHLQVLVEMGIQVRDLEDGLIDFPSFMDEREILLCWRLAEPTIRFWHGVDEGFNQRQPIDDLIF